MFDQRALEVRIVGRDGWTYTGHFWRHAARVGHRQCAVYRPPRFIPIFETTLEVVMLRKSKAEWFLGCAFGLCVVILFFIFLASASAGFLMLVWNALMPAMFHFPAMSFWHALAAIGLLSFVRWILMPSSRSK